MLEKYPDLAETELNIYQIQANYESQYRISVNNEDTASQMGFSPGFNHLSQNSVDTEDEDEGNHNHNKRTRSKIKRRTKTKTRTKRKRKRGRPKKKRTRYEDDEDYYEAEVEDFESEQESENENESMDMSQSQDDDDEESEFEETEEDEIRDSDHESNKWCVCQKPSLGDMIKCDNTLCSIQWFHWKCMRIMKIPKDKWYCKSCRKYPTKSNLLHAKFVKSKKKKKRRR